LDPSVRAIFLAVEYVLHGAFLVEAIM